MLVKKKNEIKKRFVRPWDVLNMRRPKTRASTIIIIVFIPSIIIRNKLLSVIIEEKKEIRRRKTTEYEKKKYDFRLLLCPRPPRVSVIISREVFAFRQSRGVSATTVVETKANIEKN